MTERELRIGNRNTVCRSWEFHFLNHTENEAGLGFLGDSVVSSCKLLLLKCPKIINKKACLNKADRASDFNFQDHGESKWVVWADQANRYAYDHLYVICRHCDALEFESCPWLLLKTKDSSCRGRSRMAD